MSDASRLKLIIIGFILALVAAGYFLFAQRIRVNNNKSQTQVINVKQSPSPSVLRVITQASPLPSQNPSPTPIPQVAGQMANAQNLTKGGQPLPVTGFPAGLVGIFGVSAAISGYFLRKYPK